MRIKKIAPVTPANGNIENNYGTSQSNTYSQEYINGNNTPVPIPDSAFTNFLTGTMDTNHSFIIGNSVFINIRISGATKPANGWRTLLNIAEAYRPTSEAHPIIQVPYTQLKLNSVIYNNGDIGINEQSDSWGSNIINIFAIYYKN